MMNDLLIEIQYLCQKRILLIYNKLKIFGFLKLFVFVQFLYGFDTMNGYQISQSNMVMVDCFWFWSAPCAHTDISMCDYLVHGHGITCLD